MKKIPILLVFAFILSACDTWGVPPQPFPVWTPIPSRTPGVVTATPLILLLPTFPTVAAETPTTDVPTIFPTPINSETPSATFSVTPVPPSETVTFTPAPSVSVDILGCNTGIDILHGMGEVTNAFVNINNTGTADLPNICALLNASDEDRQHPGKISCVDNLPAQYRVTFKLTVDSAYKESTAIQVLISSNAVSLLQADRSSCTDISLFGGEPVEIGVPSPIQP